MSTGDARRSHVRIAAAILAALLLAAVVFTYLAYTAAFTSTDTVTVTSPRAGLVMEKDAKVKYRGIQIGEVKTIEYAGDQAKLTLAIDSNQLRYIPSNAVVRIAGTTVFGAKSVEFVPPDQPDQVLDAAGRSGAGVVGAAGGQHALPDADRCAAQDRPGQPERDTDRAGGGVAGQRRRPGRDAVRAELLSAATESEAADTAGGFPEGQRWWPTSTATPGRTWPGSSRTRPRSATPSSTSRTI